MLSMSGGYSSPDWTVCSATANPDGRTRALLVGGGIANFTDVALTFKGIIQVRSTEGAAKAKRCM